MAERRENIRINVNGQDDASDDIEQASRSVRDLGDAADGADADVKRLGAAADQAEDEIDDLGNVADKASEKFDALKGGLAAIAGFLAFEFARETIAAANNISEVATASGVSAEALGKYTVAAERAEVELKGIGATMQGLAVSISEAVRPTSAAAAAFEELGLKSEDLKKLNENARFETVIDALQQVEDFTKRAELGTVLLGDKFGDIEPLILKASGSLGKYREEAERTGKAITQDQIQAAEKAEAAFRELESVTSGLSDELILELAPALTEVLQAVSDLFKFLESSGVMKAFGDSVSFVVNGLRDTVGFLNDIGSALGIFIEDVVTGQKSIEQAAESAAKVFEQERKATEEAKKAAQELGEVGEEAGDKIAESFTDAAESIKSTRTAIDDITDSMADLGITSQEELDKAADNLAKLLEQAKANNVAIEDQRRIFTQYAAAQRAAYEFRSDAEKKQLEDQLKQQEVQLGLRDINAEILEQVRQEQAERAKINKAIAEAAALAQDQARAQREAAKAAADLARSLERSEQVARDLGRRELINTEAADNARALTEQLKAGGDAVERNISLYQILIDRADDLIERSRTSIDLQDKFGGITLDRLRAALDEVKRTVDDINASTQAATERFEQMRLEFERAQAEREAEEAGRLEEFRLQQQLEQRLENIRKEAEFSREQRAELERLAKRDHDAELARIEDRRAAERRAQREREQEAAERAAGSSSSPPPSPANGQRPSGGSITLNITGGLVDKDFVEQKLIPQLNRVSQLTNQRNLI